MITTSDAMKVMLHVQACHHRTAPRMDDDDVTIATAAIWAKLFNVYRLELPDLTDAVEKRAETHADAPEPAEIIHHAREIRRDRDARQGPSAEYQALCESKGEDTRELEANRQRLNEIIGDIAERKTIDHEPEPEPDDDDD